MWGGVNSNLHCPSVFCGVQCSMQFINPKILVNRSHHSLRFRMGHASAVTTTTLVDEWILKHRFAGVWAIGSDFERVNLLFGWRLPVFVNSYLHQNLGVCFCHTSNNNLVQMRDPRSQTHTTMIKYPVTPVWSNHFVECCQHTKTSSGETVVEQLVHNLRGRNKMALKNDLCLYAKRSQ